MLDRLVDLTHLPNWHPAVLHFPIALWPVAVLAELSGLAWPRQAWLRETAAAGYGLAAVGAVGAYWTGRQAAESVTGLDADALAAVAAHSDSALWTAWVLVVLAASRIAFELRAWTVRVDVAGRAVSAALALAALALLLRTADLGGGLVFTHGVAVQRTEAGPTGGEPDREPTGDPRAATRSSRLETAPDRTTTWIPVAADGGRLGDAVSVVAAVEDAVMAATGERVATGLPLRIAGPALLLLPGEHGDVHVEATLELADLDGRVGVAHHVQDLDRADLFVLSTDGEASLLRVRDGATEVLGAGTVELPAGELTLAVSAAGRHLQGLVGGVTVAHGHAEPGPPGRCGITVEGTGTIRVHRVRVTPTAAE